jgi:predicted acetyltransferase
MAYPAIVDVTVIRATADQEPILQNLLELYAHDFSEFHNVVVGEDGRFGYQHLSRYWQDPNLHPFLIRVDGRLAGFALVQRGSKVSGDETTWDMAEFFILRGYRRHGAGTHAAHELWRMLPGPWEVRVMETNRKALPFWEHAVSEFLNRPVGSMFVDKGTKRWHVFSFHAPTGLSTRSSE